VLVGPPAGDLHVLSDRRPIPPYVIAQARHCPSARYCEPEPHFCLLTRALGDHCIPQATEIFTSLACPIDHHNVPFITSTVEGQ
jgi:hypothetical protein